MEIKKSSSTPIQANISPELKESSPSISNAKSGNAAIRDQFETVKPDPLKVMLSDSSTSPVSSRNQVLNEAKQKFTNFLTFPSTELSTAQGSSEMGDIFATMMSYLKMVQKEAREDRKTQGMSNQAELKMKEGKFELEKQNIEQMKTEAAERFDHAMDAANTEMSIGIASGIAQIASHIKSEVAANSQDEGEQKTIDLRYQSFISWLNDKDD